MFDHIIMNPPYSGSLHLKILREAMKHSDDIVNLSPIRWLQDPLYKEKPTCDFYKFADIRKHTESLDVISATEANKHFGIGLFADLGIYHITEKGGFDCASLHFTNSILEKVLEHKDHIYDHVSHGFKNGKWNLKFAEIRGFGGGDNYDIVSKRHRTPYFNVEDYAKNKFQKGDCVKEDYENEWFLPFNTKEEGENFADYTYTKFFHYVNKHWKLDQNVPLKFLPFMPTYKHPWTDTDLYKYFGLTDDEIKIIEEEMEK